MFTSLIFFRLFLGSLWQILITHIKCWNKISNFMCINYRQTLACIRVNLSYKVNLYQAILIDFKILECMFVFNLCEEVEAKLVASCTSIGMFLQDHCVFCSFIHLVFCRLKFYRFIIVLDMYLMRILSSVLDMIDSCICFKLYQIF